LWLDLQKIIKEISEERYSDEVEQKEIEKEWISLVNRYGKSWIEKLKREYLWK
jgi:hypothetical protein